MSDGTGKMLFAFYFFYSSYDASTSVESNSLLTSTKNSQTVSFNNTNATGSCDCLHISSLLVPDDVVVQRNIGLTEYFLQLLVTERFQNRIHL